MRKEEKGGSMLPKLYRKRFMPEETVYLKDDIVLFREKDILVSKWDVLHPKEKFSHGISCYYLEKGWKISKFLNKKKELVYYYCDIIDTEYDAATDTYLFTDLLADVIIYPNGSVQVVDLGEIAEALETGLIGEREVKLALQRLDALLKEIYGGNLEELLKPMEREEIPHGQQDT